jgi:hypothetical protein
MQYLLLLYLDEAAWPSFTPEEKEQGLAAYTAYGAALKQAGAYVSASRLRPSSDATRVRLHDGTQQVLDGPYADSKEQIAGYYLIEAPDLDAALAWAARCPAAGHGTVEVRPLWSM